MPKKSTIISDEKGLFLRANALGLAADYEQKEMHRNNPGAQNRLLQGVIQTQGVTHSIFIYHNSKEIVAVIVSNDNPASQMVSE